MSNEARQTTRWISALEVGDALSQEPTFNDAEFYGHSDLIEVTGCQTVIIESTGDPVVVDSGRGLELRDPGEFRSSFPSGHLPFDDPAWEMISSAWFEIRIVDASEDEEPEVADSLTDAISRARDLAGLRPLEIPRTFEATAIATVAQAMNRR